MPCEHTILGGRKKRSSLKKRKLSYKKCNSNGNIHKLSKPKCTSSRVKHHVSRKGQRK